jgi:two-component system LytT family response regulator
MIRVLVVDDEPLAREALTKVISERDDIADCETAEDALEALERLKNSSFDVMLLDINMPELSGMQMLSILNEGHQPLPAVIFVTAHQQHAVMAFEHHAVDYVLKPFSHERVHAAIDAAIRRTQAERAAQLMGTLQKMQSTRKSNRIAIKADGRIVFLDPAEIMSVEAEGNYVLLQRQSGSYLLREAISVVAKKLAPFGFLRIHRSVMVNAAYVAEIHPWYTGEYVLKMKNGKEYSVTRTYKRNLGTITEHWIGTEGFTKE